MRKTTSGFTIVELLIVIVVVAILAAISIVAYNGIQTRAENNKTIASVNNLVKLLTIYKEINGTYPSTGSSYACIGTGYQDGVCHIAPDGLTMTGIEQPSFNSSLASVGSIPQASTKRYTQTSNNQVVAGASFESSSRMIRYFLSGINQPCSAGGSGPYNYDTVFTNCRITMP